MWSEEIVLLSKSIMSNKYCNHYLKCMSNIATFAFFFKLRFFNTFSDPSDLYHVNSNNLDLTSKINDEYDGNSNNFNVCFFKSITMFSNKFFQNFNLYLNSFS